MNFSVDNVSSSTGCDSGDEEEEEKKKLREHYELGIVRDFGCSEEGYLKTKIVKDINEPLFKVYSKGSIKDILNLCKPESVPKNIKEIINECKKEGKKVIALSAKLVKISYAQALKTDRKIFEKNMTFLGLIALDKTCEYKGTKL